LDKRLSREGDLEGPADGVFAEAVLFAFAVVRLWTGPPKGAAMKRPAGVEVSPLSITSFSICAQAWSSLKGIKSMVCAAHADAKSIRCRDLFS
jgi:hypothetical protein